MPGGGDDPEGVEHPAQFLERAREHARDGWQLEAIALAVDDVRAFRSTLAEEGGGGGNPAAGGVAPRAGVGPRRDLPTDGAGRVIVTGEAHPGQVGLIVRVRHRDFPGLRGEGETAGEGSDRLIRALGLAGASRGTARAWRPSGGPSTTSGPSARPWARGPGAAAPRPDVRRSPARR